MKIFDVPSNLVVKGFFRQPVGTGDSKFLVDALQSASQCAFDRVAPLLHKFSRGLHRRGGAHKRSCVTFSISEVQGVSEQGDNVATVVVRSEHRHGRTR